jgi:cell division protein FtsI/penicillin-binding protein 2
MTFSKKKIFLLCLISFVFGANTLKNYQEKRDEEFKRNSLSFVKSAVSHQIVSENSFPKTVKHEEADYEVNYTINWKLQEKLEKLLKRYTNDHSAIVILDNNNGKILAASGIDRKSKQTNYSLPFTSTHPSASLFKIITTADLLQGDKVEPHTRMNYRGRGTTLYKYQLKNKISRWTRWISFKKAFAYSNNVIFGKAAIQRTSGHSIFKKAFNFGFNRQIMFDFNLGPSRFSMPESQYELAEMASGFNKETMISPVHAALLSSIVASGGHFQTPSIITDVKNEDKTFKFKKIREKILDDQTVEDLHQMMTLTVEKGTARGISRGRLGRKLLKKYIVGAKTGSITGGVPFGKRDWLSFFAKPVDNEEDDGISVAIMNVNGKRWYYKSSFLAKKVLEIIEEVKVESIAKTAGDALGES